MRCFCSGVFFFFFFFFFFYFILCCWCVYVRIIMSFCKDVVAEVMLVPCFVNVIKTGQCRSREVTKTMRAL